MTSITVRRIEDRVKAKLRARAARHGRSMEEEVREILRAAADEPLAKAESLWDAIRRHVEPVGGVELQLPIRHSVRRRSVFAE